MECDLTLPQKIVGYITLLNFVKVIGAGLFAAGFIIFAHEAIRRILNALRYLLEFALYGLSFGLMAGGYWLPAEHQTWAVFTGCLLFAGAVTASIFIHEIKGDDPKPLASLYTLVWGAVASFYGSTEVAFLAVLALMTLLNFTVVVSRLSYGFGWYEKDHIAPGTMAALLLLSAGVAGTIWGKSLPMQIAVFYPALVWVGGFVGFLGILCMASSYYSRDTAQYVTMQLLAAIFYGGGLAVGLLFTINPLAGLAGVFAAFWAAEKPLDIKPENAYTFGFCLMVSGAVMYAAWQFGLNNLPAATSLLQKIGG